MIKRKLDLYLNTPALGIVHAAEVVLAEEAGVLAKVGFRYRQEYLGNPHAFAIDPVQLPLRRAEVVFDCYAGLVPGFLDDYLPDDWGRKVLARIALYRDGRRLNRNSVLELLDVMESLDGAGIGAMRLNSPPHRLRFGLGENVQALADVEGAARRLEDGLPETNNVEALSVFMLGNTGSRVGGARAKALLYDGQGAYLAKFNAGNDRYNNARVELACLEMARAAGLDVGAGRVCGGVNDREVLLLDRFDVEGPCDARRHLVTVNALLKDPRTQADVSPFRYDDIHDLLRRHSDSIEHDLDQLVRRMLFNAAIHNTDDHERNFSLIGDADGYRLSPAYDMVPSIVDEPFHAAGYRLKEYPPTPTEALRMGGIFGLTKSESIAIAEQVIDVVNRWPDFAAQAGVSEEDAMLVQRYFK